MKKHGPGPRHTALSKGRERHQRECLCGVKTPWRDSPRMADYELDLHRQSVYRRLCDQYVAKYPKTKGIS